MLLINYQENIKIINEIFFICFNYQINNFDVLKLLS